MSTVDYLHVDAATIFLVTDPARFDVIVTDNLFGDILTDLAGAISGGIGLAASGNINPDGAFPSMFEPVHGSAPDIAGKQHRRPHRRDPLRRAPARPPRSCRMPRRRSARRSTADLAERGDATRIDLRGRRRDRRPHRRTSTDPAHPKEAHHDDQPPAPGPVSRRAHLAGHPQRAGQDATPSAPRSSPTRASASTSPTTWSTSAGRRRADGTARACQPYGPIPLDPAAAVLHYAQEIFEGLKAYRHADGSIWTLPPRRRTRPACSARPRGSRCPSCRPSTSSTRSSSSSRSTAPGCRPRPRRASTCARSCSRRRRSSACAPRRRSPTT